MQAEQQLLGEEGLGDIVVRSQAQPLEPVGVLVPGGEEQYRHVPVFPELPQQGETVPVRQVHVQQHRVRRRGLKPLQRLGAGEGGRRIITAWARISFTMFCRAASSSTIKMR